MSIATQHGTSLGSWSQNWYRLRSLSLKLATLGLVLLALGWPSDHPAMVITLTAITTYAFFCWTSYFHEAAHHTLQWATKRDNILWGRIIGTVLLVPYTAYRETHIRHHAYLNTPADWELWPYTDPTKSRTFRRIFVWVDLLFGIYTHILIYGRIYFHRNSPLTREVRRTIRNEYLGSIAFWAIALSAVAWFGVWKEFAFAWVIPVSLAGIIQTGRKLTEHLGMREYDPLLGTRTVVGRTWLTRLASFLNYHIFIHGLHHRHPRVPHEELHDRMQAYVRQNPDVHYPVFSSYWRATWDMLPHFFKNPGCGMNAGAAPPPKSKMPDVKEFVGDVSAEILAVSGEAER